MIPVISLVGLPNVGKSMLFNRLTRTVDALVIKYAGSTRDRKYGKIIFNNYKFIIIDTGGIHLYSMNSDNIYNHINNQTFLAIQESDLVLFVVDAKVGGVIDDDCRILKYLYKFKKNIIIVINKVDGLDKNNILGYFYSLGVKTMVPISAISGYGIKLLLRKIIILTNTIVLDRNNHNLFNNIKIQKNNYNFLLNASSISIKLAVLGRPNVGKSTFVNCISNDNRSIVHNIPGTTRDYLSMSIVYDKQQYIIYDTAGIRKYSQSLKMIEQYSVIKSLQVIEKANIVVLLIDACDGLVDQDLSLLHVVLNKRKSVVIAVNKWDKLSSDKIQNIQANILNKLNFVSYIRVHFISSLYDFGIHCLFKSIVEAYNCSLQRITIRRLTKIMISAVNNFTIPIKYGYQIKFKYIHIGGYNPPLIVIHGMNVKWVTDNYKRYLINYFSNALKIMGMPIQIHFHEVFKKNTKK